MKMLLKFLVAAGICVALPVQAETLEQLQSQWRAINAMPPPQKFDKLVPRLVAYRQQSGGKSWQLNYMLGSSYCRIPGQEAIGKSALYRVLAGYGLPDTVRAKAEQVIANCGQSIVSPDEPSFSLVVVSGQTAAVVHGKGGYEVDSRSKPASGKIQRSPVPLAELQSRVFVPRDSGKALAAAVARVQSPGVRSAVRNGFVVVSSGDMAPEAIADCLVQYRGPLESQFEMQKPAALITVYVPPGNNLAEYSSRLHGVNLPLGTVAYSVYDDLSIVGIGSYESCGTLAHELVHLSIRQNFGDSPAWLEEGLASEVAVTRPSQTELHFSESWRDEVLRRHWALRPNVAQLLKATWADYAAEDISQVDRAAALHAMAAAFIRYLDSAKKLVPVYMSMRDSLSSPGAPSDQEILESSLGKPLKDLDDDFVKWFKAPPH